MTKANQRLGNLTEQDINFPKHLTPEIVHTALYIHNASDKIETMNRVKYCTKQIGEQAMSYAMALLVMPMLMDNMRDSDLYKDFITSRKKTIN
jgi:hypothetical protein|tara:strand:- start:75 stop:353 length:279 start_codon:yes stop_codon:yes gene_type:complete